MSGYGLCWPNRVTVWMTKYRPGNISPRLPLSKPAGPAACRSAGISRLPRVLLRPPDCQTRYPSSPALLTTAAHTSLRTRPRSSEQIRLSPRALRRPTDHRTRPMLGLRSLPGRAGGGSAVATRCWWQVGQWSWFW